MFSEIYYYFTILTEWQKSLLFSFISYTLVLFGLIVAITFLLKDFNFVLVIALSSVYMGSVVVAMLVARKVFKKRLIG